MDLSEMLANWKAGKLRQAPTKALLGRLEKAHKAAVEKIRESRTMTPEIRRLEENEARREFRTHWNRMRSQVLAGYDAEITQAKAKANPPASDAMLQRMNLLGGIHVSRWERSAGNLIADAIDFERQGDEAGLRLARQHLGVLELTQRSKAAGSIDEALDAFKSDDQRKAEQEVRNLETEHSRFELGSGLHGNFIRHTTEPIRPPASTPSPAMASQR